MLSSVPVQNRGRILLIVTPPLWRTNEREFSMNLKKTILLAAAAMTMALGTVANASAETNWQDHHPRRVEVNHRLERQDARIDREYRQGKISFRQARFEHAEDRRIARRERRDARFDRGHITRGEDQRLNHEENNVSQQISGR
jgi:hypothetical protein